MVPSLERSEYMYELRNIAENIVMERCKNSEVHLPTHTEYVESYKVADADQDSRPKAVPWVLRKPF